MTIGFWYVVGSIPVLAYIVWIGYRASRGILTEDMRFIPEDFFISARQQRPPRQTPAQDQADMEYFRNKLFTALRIPRHLIMPEPWTTLQSLKDGLREDQQPHLRSLTWLLDDRYMGRGRTHVLAIAFIEQAIRRRGAWITPFDHEGGRGNHGTHYLMETIRARAEQFPGPSPWFEFRNGSLGQEFRYSGPQMAPPEEGLETEAEAFEREQKPTLPPEEPKRKHRALDLE